MKLPKKIIDTNIILRFLLADDEKQFLKAKAFIQKLEYGEDEALLPEIVFAEVVWVLSFLFPSAHRNRKNGWRNTKEGLRMFSLELAPRSVLLPEKQ